MEEIGPVRDLVAYCSVRQADFRCAFRGPSWGEARESWLLGLVRSFGAGPFLFSRLSQKQGQRVGEGESSKSDIFGGLLASGPHDF